MVCVGIDAGSRAVKIAIIDANTREIVATDVTAQGVHSDEITENLLDELLQSSGISRSEIAATVDTGYARNIIKSADTTITEITCHARGVNFLMPDARTVIEIGGQDSKLLRLEANGSVRDFVMNDRCAAGTGRFLEVVAERLELELSELGALAARSESPAQISSMCIVFAETEIIGLLASGVAAEDIVSGAQNSIATRLSTMVGRNVAPPVAFTGGVAMIPGMDRALANVLEQEITIVPTPQFTGAIGAAALACERIANKAPARN